MARLSNYYLLVITANGCSACEAFKENWPKMKPQLSNLVTVIEINQPSVSNFFDKKYPAGLDMFAKWFPTLLLVSKSEYDSMQIRQAQVFNGEIVRGKVQMKANRAVLNTNNVMTWINSST